MASSSDCGSAQVDAYLTRIEPRARVQLRRLRALIRSAAPEATEMISYRMPAFRHHGMLVYYAAFRDHCSFFVGSGAVRSRFRRELAPFARGRGTLQFTEENPLPASLVRRLVRARVLENEARRGARAGSGKRVRPRVRLRPPARRVRRGGPRPAA